MLRLKDEKAIKRFPVSRFAHVEKKNELLMTAVVEEMGKDSIKKKETKKLENCHSSPYRTSKFPTYTLLNTNKEQILMAVQSHPNFQ